MASFASFGFLAPILLAKSSKKRNMNRSFSNFFCYCCENKPKEDDMNQLGFDESKRFKRLSLSSKKFTQDCKEYTAKKAHPFIGYWKKYIEFMNLPRSHFVFDTVPFRFVIWKARVLNQFKAFCFEVLLLDFLGPVQLHDALRVPLLQRYRPAWSQSKFLEPERPKVAKKREW